MILKKLQTEEKAAYILLIIHTGIFYLHYAAYLSVLLYFIIFSHFVDIHVSALANIYPVVWKLGKNHENHFLPFKLPAKFHNMSKVVNVWNSIQQVVLTEVQI